MDKEFLTLVSLVRRLQKEFFKFRDPHTLKLCKQAEQQLDKKIIDLETKQQSLKLE